MQRFIIAAMVSAASLTASAQTPVLTWTAATIDYIEALPNGAPPKYKNFRGLLIEENMVKELYPLLPYVFFDSASAIIPERYALFSDPSQTQRYSENIAGGTLQKYNHVLNIIGMRLRDNPNARLTVTGCNSGSGETRDISKARAQAVYDYLVNIWGIDPARIKFTVRDLPEFPSNPRDQLGAEENRRVELSSDNWEIVKPIISADLRRYPQPDSVLFHIDNGIADDEVAARRIEIKRHGVMWHVMSDSTIGRTRRDAPGYNWGAWGDMDSIPQDEEPYVAQLVVRSRDGVERRSAEVEIPVLIMTNERKWKERLIDKRIERYSILLFAYGKATIDAYNDRVLREYISASISSPSRIAVYGYSDVIEAGPASRKLAAARATAVADGIRRYVPKGAISSMDASAAPDYTWLYSTKLPEGRCLDRTVQVIVETSIVAE